MFGFFTLTNEYGKKIRGRVLAPRGNKPVVVFVHGLGGGMFEPQYRVLKKALTLNGFGVCMFDMINSLGRSSFDPQHLSVQDYARDFANVVAHLRAQGFSDLVYFGHSLGGGLVLDALAREGAGVRGAVLLNPFVTHADTAFDRVESVLGKLPMKFSRMMKHFTITQKNVTSFLEFDTIPKAQLITTPLLVMRGKYDKVIPPTQIEALCSRVSGPVVKKTYDYFGHTFLHTQSLKKINDWAQEVVVWIHLLKEKK
ncbi:alpha/beta fold hydrolase [Candidatus Falkowbacteria bacterium]|nr:alpha/beta fold hydrolase [Candidatus Falkowbacteria bacterium]